MGSEVRARLCVDCVVADANGSDTPQEEGGPSPEWPGFRPEWAGWLFSPVHDEWGDASHGFSWSPCHGCLSHLGGDRYDYVAVPR